MDNIKFNPNRALSHNVSRILVFVLFLTSFILLWPFSLSLELDVVPYACVKKTGNLLDNKTKFF